MNRGYVFSRRPIAVLCAFALATLWGPAAGAAGRSPKRPVDSHLKPSDHAPREVIVQFRRGITASARSQVRSLVGSTLIEHLPLRDMQVVRTPSGSTVAEVVRELERRPEVAFAEPNYLYRAADVPNDPLYPSMWPLVDGSTDADLDAPSAWEVTKGSRNVTVAVVDSGIAFDHPDLSANVWSNPGESGSLAENRRDDDDNGYVDDIFGWDYVDDDGVPYDMHGHGTHVAGTIGAIGDNGLGIAGINWRVRIMALNVLQIDGSGSASDVAAAFIYARDNGARIVNASIGSTDYSRAIAAAVSSSPNVLFVGAAGNASRDIDETDDYPCSLPYSNVVCVASSTSRDALSSFSNYGDRTVDLAAPGSSIVSTTPHFETFFEEDFEDDVGDRWVTGGTNDSWDQAVDEYGGYIEDSPGGDYLNSTDAWIRTREPIDLDGTNGCVLAFVLELDIERNVDGFLIEGSHDAARWKQLAGYSGETDDWRSISISLGDFHDGPLYLRLRLVTDPDVTSDGVSIDDLEIECATPDFTENDYRFFSGTSMAAPHVTGASALLLSVDRGASPTEIKDALLDGADRRPALLGRVASGRLSLAGALQALGIDVPVPDPTPTDLPVDIDPSVTPTPRPSVTPTPIGAHGRTALFSLRRHLIVSGQMLTDGPVACIVQVPIKILRNGRVVENWVTTSTGRIRVGLPDRRGVYRVIAPRHLLATGGVCARAVSDQHRHHH